jgi:DNA polymerase-1
MQKLLYETLGLPVLDKTKKKQPATGNKTLTKLKHHTQDPLVLELLNALVEIAKVSKILTAFIPSFKDAWLKADGCHYLHGNYNLGAVVSGRLSCSRPNMQQIPSGSTYGKLIKDCFSAPKGWILGGADFSSLEDKINTLLTRDPNKMKVYTDGYDGHALRTHTYFKDQMPDVRQSEPSDRCFKISIKGQDIYMKSGDFIVDCSGNKIPMEKYFEDTKF